MKNDILNSLLFCPKNEWNPHSKALSFSSYGLLLTLAIQLYIIQAAKIILFFYDNELYTKDNYTNN